MTILQTPTGKLDLKKARKRANFLRSRFFDLPLMDADDLVQEYWISRLTRRSQMEHVLIDHVRKELGDSRNRKKYHKKIPILKADLFSKEYLWQHPPSKIRDSMLEGLTRKEKQFIRWYFEKGLTLKEVGARLKRSESWAVIECHRILNILRGKYGYRND